jgi:hypothetical protein
MALSETTDAMAIPRPADAGGDPFDTSDYRSMVNLVDAYVADKGADLASATTIDLPATLDGHYMDITGTTTITAIESKAAGTTLIFQFDSTPQITHHATSMILPGGVNHTMVAKDHWMFVSLGGGNWSGFPLTKTRIEQLSAASEARGDVIYRGASAWSRLAASTDGYVLATNTSSGDPAWEQVAAAGIASNAVTTAKVNADAITGAKIADDAIDSEHYTDGSIDNAHLAADAVTGAKIADDAIDSEHYVGASIDAAHIASNAVTTAKLNADSVTAAKIGDDVIDSEHYADGSIDNAHIADDAIDSEHYADGSIDNAHIADDAIDSEHYADGSIDSAHLADNAVTLAKTAHGTQGGIQYYAGSGVPSELAAGTDGYFLKTQGGSANPVWAAAASGGPSQAVQSDIEAETNEDTYLPPDLVHFAPSAAKFYVKFDASAGVQGTAYNTTSVADNGTGDWTVTIGTDFSSADWACSCTIETGYTRSANIASSGGQAAGTLQVRSTDNNGTMSDGVYMHVAGFGDL